ncbi:MAG: guanylate kinase [Verrucomicrobiae bacterium]|nr:guanylate kinase [Verrucomicrobiae bacterium]
MSTPKTIPLLIVLSAPSGAGKTTLSQGLLDRESNVCRAVTCTTRKPREGEKDGADYYFFSAEEFLKRVQSGHFLEHATVYGNSYGTLKSEVRNHLRAGRDVLLAVDVQGAAAIRKQAAGDAELARSLVEVFILPPSLEELRRRLEDRAADPPEAVRRRLNEARNEIAQWKNYDYVIESATKESDLRNLRSIYTAERLKQSRQKPPAVTSESE